MSVTKPISAAILTVGTEITSGEIQNSNSKWLAEQLEKLGFDVTLHLSVPDDRVMIKDALEFSKKYCEVFIVTGGLGPTSDDFTREVIADWADAPLEFRESSWRTLEEIYHSRKLNLKPSHRQQCYYPANAALLKNRVGTADGFCLHSRGTHVLVLPGPPREILAMWEPSVVPRLKTLNAGSLSVLHRWICFGVPESEVAEKVEALIKGKGVRVGYRASKPYVHVKLWVPVNTDSSQLLKSLGESLARWQVHDGKDREDG